MPNKRIRKKKLRAYHRRFCHSPLPGNKAYSSWQPKCGWDSLDADEDCKLGTILWQHGGFYDLEFCIEYTCPVCGTVFDYMDGV